MEMWNGIRESLFLFSRDVGKSNFQIAGTNNKICSASLLSCCCSFSPTKSSRKRRIPNLFSLAMNPAWVVVQNKPRSTSYGCLSTTIICAWAAIHPASRRSKGTLRRLELMFWTIVAPEIPPAWAPNQRLAAMTIRDMCNEGESVFSLTFQ